MNGFEKDNENPYRLYRVVSVKKIDRWFFEKHNHRRTHAKIYETVIRPKFGICENTFLDYRHESDELLELFRQSVNVEFSMWLPTMEAKYMSPVEADRFSLMRPLALVPLTTAGSLHGSTSGKRPISPIRWTRNGISLWSGSRFRNKRAVIAQIRPCPRRHRRG